MVEKRTSSARNNVFPKKPTPHCGWHHTRNSMTDENTAGQFGRRVFTLPKMLGPGKSRQPGGPRRVRRSRPELPISRLNTTTVLSPLDEDAEIAKHHEQACLSSSLSAIGSRYWQWRRSAWCSWRARKSRRNRSVSPAMTRSTKACLYFGGRSVSATTRG